MKTLKELMNLHGRVAVITGGAGHIGFAMAEALTELGASVALIDMHEQEAHVRARAIEEHNAVECLPLAIDLTNDGEVRSVPLQIHERFGRLDILIHSAALVGTSELEGWAVPFQDQSLETWRKALEVNLTAVFVLTQACKDLLTASGHGSVINVSSMYGMVGPQMALYEGTSFGNPAAYAASKGGVLQLTRWLATVMAPSVRVNAISPGGVYRNQPEPFLSRYIERTPLKRMAIEEDLKGAITYLASDLSSYVTGHNLVVDGGWTAW